jgi:hypothetical protein
LSKRLTNYNDKFGLNSDFALALIKKLLTFDFIIYIFEIFTMDKKISEVNGRHEEEREDQLEEVREDNMEAAKKQQQQQKQKNKNLEKM